MADIDTRALDRELKRGSAELLILSLLDARPRHGYELGKLIHTRSGGQLTFHIDSLYPLLYRLEERGWIKGASRGSAPLGPALLRLRSFRLRGVFFPGLRSSDAGEPSRKRRQPGPKPRRTEASGDCR
jgi:Transcriptional regulator PadR-like family